MYERNSYVNLSHPEFQLYNFYKEGGSTYSIYTIENQVYAVVFHYLIPVAWDYDPNESLSSFQQYFINQSVENGFDFYAYVVQYDFTFLSIGYFAYLKDSSICTLVNDSLIYGIVDCNYVSFSEIKTILENDGFFTTYIYD